VWNLPAKRFISGAGKAKVSDGVTRLGGLADQSESRIEQSGGEIRESIEGVGFRIRKCYWIAWGGWVMSGGYPSILECTTALGCFGGELKTRGTESRKLKPSEVKNYYTMVLVFQNTTIE
jgi:hypothetical protein